MKDESKVFSGYLIKFNQVCKNGDMYLPDSITVVNLQNLKISGKIEDFEIDENGIKTIKVLKLESGSL